MAFINDNLGFGFNLFSSPAPKAHRRAYSILMLRRRCCRRPPFSNVFSSETAWQMKAKFYVEPKVYINGSGHMTKMAHIW